jgi:hypothetical protein
MLILVFFMLVLTCCKPKYDENTCVLVATVYSVSISYPEELPQYINSNKSALTANRKFDYCIGKLSNALLISAIKSPSRDEVQERSMKIASDAGAPELGSRVADDMMKTSGDMYQLGLYLKQLRNSTPQILNGNIDEYKNTDIYQLSSLVWNLSGNFLDPGQVKKLREITFKLSYWYVLSLLQSMN